MDRLLARGGRQGAANPAGLGYIRTERRRITVLDEDGLRAQAA